MRRDVQKLTVRLHHLLSYILYHNVTIFASSFFRTCMKSAKLFSEHLFNGGYLSISEVKMFHRSGVLYYL